MMSTMQLNAELYRAMGQIADDEVLLEKVLKYVKRLAAKRNDDSLMSREEFMAKLDKGEEDYRQGKCYEMLPGEDLDDFLQRVG